MWKGANGDGSARGNASTGSNEGISKSPLTRRVLTRDNVETAAILITTLLGALALLAQACDSSADDAAGAAQEALALAEEANGLASAANAVAEDSNQVALDANRIAEESLEEAERSTDTATAALEIAVREANEDQPILTIPFSGFNSVRSDGSGIVDAPVSTDTSTDQIYFRVQVRNSGEFAARKLGVGWQTREMADGGQTSGTWSHFLSGSTTLEPFDVTMIHLPLSDIACRIPLGVNQDVEIRAYVGSGQGNTFSEDFIELPAQWVAACSQS